MVPSTIYPFLYPDQLLQYVNTFVESTMQINGADPTSPFCSPSNGIKIVVF